MVEWKKLGEFATLQKKKNKKLLIENAYSITQAGLVPTKSFFKEKTKVTSNDTSAYYIVEKDWFVYSPSRIDVGSINYLRDEGPVIVSPIDVVFSVDSNICIPAYLLDYLFTYKGKKDLLKNREGVEGMGRRNLPFDAIKGVQIPVPSLKEQTRIVGILDTFTSAIDNLKEQIAQRRKQYEYYRDELLDLEGKPGVEWKKLGDVANLVRGKVISKDYIRDFGGEYPVYSSQTANDGVLGNINNYMFDGDYLTWTTDGAHAGTIFRRKGKFSITNVCGLIDINYSNIQLDFLYFYLSKNAKDYVLEGMGNPKLMSNVASTIKIPIPSLQEQHRIVSILDTFEASISNLEAQLKEREKQYEYYRNKLLTFE